MQELSHALLASQARVAKRMGEGGAPASAPRKGKRQTGSKLGLAATRTQGWQMSLPIESRREKQRPRLVNELKVGGLAGWRKFMLIKDRRGRLFENKQTARGSREIFFSRPISRRRG